MLLKKNIVGGLWEDEAVWKYSLDPCFPQTAIILDSLYPMPHFYEN